MTKEQRLVLAIAILASFVSFLDGTIINVVLPAIRRELGGGLEAQQWIVDAYLITLGSLILVAGSVSDVYGRITVIRVGLVGVRRRVAAIALSPNVEFLIVARGRAGHRGRAPRAELARADHLELPTAPRRPRRSAPGRHDDVAMIAGPVIGGLFVDYLSWRWVFVINVIPIAVTLVLL